LSVIYEQFLHVPRADGEASAGKLQGAYYTPLPLVNFMLEELDALRPLKQGMRVLDPACGSGAFLVQCYRRLIERDEEYDPSKSMRPARLRDLLTEHIFGVDCDEDACRVARLSLTLTLLDYVSPPDLRNTPQFRLPDLQNSNILQGDFFDPEAPWRSKLQGCRFDWIVGNPPWVEIKSGRVAPEQQHVWTWMREHNRRDDCPVGGNQVAEAFAWKATEHLAEGGCAALVLPAMTLFKDESQRFRRQFFRKHRVHSVANFANLAEVLFPGHRYREGQVTNVKRPRRPTAVLFYSTPSNREQSVPVFSPMAVQQRANRPDKPGGRKDTWSIVVDNSQIRTLDVRDVADGSALPWKTAMWGSSLDLRLLKAVAARHELFRAFCERNSLNVAQGSELREPDSRDPIEPIPEVVGQLEFDPKGLAKSERIFAFPSGSLRRITPERANLRLRGGTAGLAVCRPPHILVDRLRRFAVFSDKFLVVPPRQIGIAGQDDQSDLLKALSLYLVSDFAVYHQFLVSPEWGISTSTSTLKALRLLPIPFSDFTKTDLSEWARLHAEIVAAARDQGASSTPLFDRPKPKSASLDALLKDLNDRVYGALRLRPREQALVRDLVHVRMDLIQGKVSEAATRAPSDPEVRKYALMLADELDGFVEDQPALKHSVCVFRNGKAAIVRVRLHRSSTPDSRVHIEQAGVASAKDLAKIHERLRQEHSQWIYFQRDLRLYEGRNTYLFKPQERLHWTESQAILDAGTIIAETLS
jgi:methylase of polypeptide subunit release factors